MASVPFALPDIGETEIKAVVEVLESGWLTTGARTREFELEFARGLGVAHAVALNSCTAALHLALECIRLCPGDEVIVPTYTFAASAEVVHYMGGRPVLVDVCPSDLNVDANAVVKAITPRTRAIMGVDIAGHPCDWPALQSIARAHGLVLIDDAAHSLSSSIQGQPIGSWADLTAFSFYATKPLCTGEGGMLVTNDAEWAERARLMALHGINHDAWQRRSDRDSWYYEIGAPGFKYNMTDIAAAMGLVQLGRLQQMTARRAAIAAAYDAALADLPEVETPCVRRDAETSWYLYILRLNPGRLGVDRTGFVNALKTRGVGTSVHFIPLHLHPFYRQKYGYAPEDFPVAWTEYERALSLPIYSRMTDDDVQHVIDAVHQVISDNTR